MLEQYIPYFATFIVALIVALDSAAFSMLLRHSLGFPQNSSPDPKAILFGWTYKMACIALEKHDPTLLSQLKKLPISEARKRSQIAAAAREHYGFRSQPLQIASLEYRRQNEPIRSVILVDDASGPTGK